MDALSIRILRNRYRLRGPEPQRLRERLGRVWNSVLDEGLDAAVARAGLAREEHLCLRRVHAPVALSAGRPDSALAVDWSVALASAIERAIAGGGAARIRYRSRLHALIDFALGVAAGDLSRAWAWRQLGLLPAHAAGLPDAAQAALIDALEREPQGIVPLITGLAMADRLEAWSARVRAGDWTRLARCALPVHALPVALLRESPAPSAHGDPALRARALRSLARSPAALLIARAPRAQLRARVILALLVADAPVLRVAGREAGELVSWLEDAAINGLQAAAAAPWQERAPVGELTPAGRARARSARFEPQPPGAPEPTQASAAALRQSTHEREAAHADEALAAPQADARRRGLTRWGGLLFLLWLLEPVLGAAAEAPLAARALRWVLHRLALRLAPIAADDPAALAFAGLPPDATPPSLEEEPPSEQEEEALAGCRARIVAALRARLDEPEASDAQLLRQVCERSAEVAADPGWIELHLSLDEVSTAIRRSGLDLDPGYLPWLGVVMRFVYA